MHTKQGRKRATGRILRSILLFPGRIPILKIETVDTLKRICELSGIFLVLFIMAVMVYEGEIIRIGAGLTAIAFTVSFVLIRLRMYQDALIERGYMKLVH
ncbi:MAG: hypothetical protein K6G83_11720 [Lachnospiraceae bacterium]|nr:hypothetical protein [Lachnospiraceae bacterium]